MVKLAALVPAIVIISACATTPPETLQFGTPSGRPEAQFLTGDVNEAAGMVANGCMNAGMTVVSNNANQVVCEVSMTMTQQVITQFAIGNSYSSTPRQFIQFNLADVGETVRVQGTGWVETQMAFGQMRRMPMDQTIAWRNQMQQALFNIGAVPLPGTVDASKKSKIGFLAASLSSAGEVGGSSAVFVSGVYPGGPASEAGLKVCDRIDAVNGKGIVNMAGYTLEASRSGPGVPISVTVNRFGEEIQLQVVATTDPITMDVAAYQSHQLIASQGCREEDEALDTGTGPVVEGPSEAD